MKIRITSYSDKNKAFDLMKYITDKYRLEKDTKVVLNDNDTISLYLVVSDDAKSNTNINTNMMCHIPDEEIPF